MPPFCTKCGWNHSQKEKHKKTNWEALAKYWKQAYASLALHLLNGSSSDNP